jgi:heat-inducible transcriptional repressor
MRNVLDAVLDEYVETAQPVASRSVARRSRSRVSPATVRNVMAELTEAGLLTQPHTSAGRIPTEFAFRLYVDRLLERSAALPESAAKLPEALAGAAGDTEELLRSAVDLLARATGQLGFFVAAQPDRILLSQVTFVRVSSERVMAVLISERGVVQTRIFHESDTDPRTLERVSLKLTEFVAGSTLAQARARLVAAIERERARGGALWHKALELGSEGLMPAQRAELYVSDRNPLLRQPEFADVERLRELIEALEEKERMLRLLDRIIRADVLRVVIGSEIGDPGIDSCAVVTAPFGDSPPLGGMGVIGPVRMRYAVVIPLVRSLSEHVSQVLS